MKKSILFLLATVLICGAMAGLSGCISNPNIHIDETKTQLLVYSFDGGVGTEWLENVKTRFERDFAEYEFEPGSGKKGVQIVIGKGKDTLTSSLTTSPYEVIFSESVNYNNMITQKLVMDISDIVETKTLSDVSGGVETGKIADKLTDEQKSAFKAVDGKHYVLPHYEVYSGIVYDKKVFAEKQLYFKKTGGWTGTDSEKSVGPDGEYGTYDDGLPSSFEEFENMMDRMVMLQIEPFIWSGQYTEYTNHMLLGMWAAFAGKEEFMLNFNYGKDGLVSSGKSTTITGFNGNTPIVESVDITPATGYYLKQQEGKYYPLQLMQKIMSNSNYYSKEITGVMTHMDAQRVYINSDLKNKPIAMMVEGSYWYNEARDAFKASESTYKDKAKNRQFAWMALPRQATGSVTEGNGTKNTLVESLSAFAFINNTIKDDANKTYLAKLFLQYCYTDESLVEFTKTTGIPKGMKYDMSDSDINAMSNYGQSLFEVKSSSDIVYPYSDNKIFIYNQERVLESSSWKSNINGTDYSYPYVALKDTKRTAKEYFLGMKMSASEWETRYGQYYKD